MSLSSLTVEFAYLLNYRQKILGTNTLLTYLTYNVFEKFAVFAFFKVCMFFFVLLNYILFIFLMHESDPWTFGLLAA